MSLAESLERVASALPDVADRVRPANGDPAQLRAQLDPADCGRVLAWLLAHEPEYGSELAVKDAGKLQVEGKDYVVADGDIMHVRFNV